MTWASSDWERRNVLTVAAPMSAVRLDRGYSTLDVADPTGDRPLCATSLAALHEWPSHCAGGRRRAHAMYASIRWI